LTNSARRRLGVGGDIPSLLVARVEFGEEGQTMSKKTRKEDQNSRHSRVPRKWETQGRVAADLRKSQRRALNIANHSFERKDTRDILWVQAQLAEKTKLQKNCALIEKTKRRQ